MLNLPQRILSQNQQNLTTCLQQWLRRSTRFRHIILHSPSDNPYKALKAEVPKQSQPTARQRFFWLYLWHWTQRCEALWHPAMHTNATRRKHGYRWYPQGNVYRKTPFFRSSYRGCGSPLNIGVGTLWDGRSGSRVCTPQQLTLAMSCGNDNGQLMPYSLPPDDPLMCFRLLPPIFQVYCFPYSRSSWILKFKCLGSWNKLTFSVMSVSSKIVISKWRLSHKRAVT